MIFCRILLVFLALLAQLYSTEPVILPLDEDQNWRALFPASELVTLRPRPNNQLASVKLHFRQNTLFKLQYDKDAAAAGRILPPTTIWEAIRIWVAIGQGRKLSIEEWKLVTPIEYHTKVGKQIGPVDEDEGYYVGEWRGQLGAQLSVFLLTYT